METNGYKNDKNNRNRKETIPQKQMPENNSYFIGCRNAQGTHSKNGCMAHTHTRATRRRAFSREGRGFGISPAANHAPKGIGSTTPYSQGFQAYLSAQSTPLGESSGWSNQRSSKISQACDGHPRCNLNLARLFLFSLPLPVFGRLFHFPHPRGHEPTAPFILCCTKPQGPVRRCSSPPS